MSTIARHQAWIERMYWRYFKRPAHPHEIAVMTDALTSERYSRKTLREAIRKAAGR